MDQQNGSQTKVWKNITSHHIIYIPKVIKFIYRAKLNPQPEEPLCLPLPQKRGFKLKVVTKILRTTHKKNLCQTKDERTLQPIEVAPSLQAPKVMEQPTYIRCEQGSCISILCGEDTCPEMQQQIAFEKNSFRLERRRIFDKPQNTNTIDSCVSPIKEENTFESSKRVDEIVTKSIRKRIFQKQKNDVHHSILKSVDMNEIPDVILDGWAKSKTNTADVSLYAFHD